MRADDDWACATEPTPIFDHVATAVRAVLVAPELCGSPQDHDMACGRLPVAPQ
jgi:hypothetical protein